MRVALPLGGRVEILPSKKRWGPPGRPWTRISNHRVPAAMKRLSVLVSCALLGLAPAACGPGSTSDPGMRTENAPATDEANLVLNVSGHAELLPEAVSYLASQGQPAPSLQDIPLILEEPLRAMLRDPEARFSTSPLAEDGAFRFEDVPARNVHLGLSAGIEHEGFARTTSVLFDTAVSNTRPHLDIISARAWAVPLAFHDALTRAVGVERIRTVTQGRASSLQEAGFVLGRIVDAQGRPVAGAHVKPDREEFSGLVFYPSEDLASAGQEGTAGSGLFVLVWTGGAPEAFRLTVDGQDAYLPRNVGGAPGLGFVLTLYPGAYAP